MDYFTIVATMERRGVYFTLVPHKWVKNKTLFWPQHLKHTGREQIRSDPSSEPDDSWSKFKCIVKITKIKTFQEGLDLEKQLTECTDTEAEEELFKKMNAPTGTAHDETIQNRNYMMLTNKTKLGTTDETQPSVSYQLFDTNDSLDETNNIGTVATNAPTILYVEKPITESNLSSENPDVLIENQNWQAELASFKGEMQEELRKIRIELRDDTAKIMTYLEEIHTKLINISRVPIHKDEATKKDYSNEIFKFPLSTVDEIEAVEAKLCSDENYKAQMIEFLCKIGGTSGQEDGTKIGYKIIDHIFTPQVLLNYSWTGVSRGNKSDKMCFQKLQGILDVVFHVILSADNRHTRQKNGNIFKDGVLKHAKKRSLRKRSLLSIEGKQNNESAENLPENVDNDEETVEDVMMENPDNTSENF